MDPITPKIVKYISGQYEARIGFRSDMTEAEINGLDMNVFHPNWKSYALGRGPTPGKALAALDQTLKLHPQDLQNP